jgi:hypothetical protein
LNLEAIGPLVAASLFGLVSGFNDGGNLMGSFTSGSVISPRATALLLLLSLAAPRGRNKCCACPCFHY